jgi:hypothetical protein
VQHAVQQAVPSPSSPQAHFLVHLQLRRGWESGARAAEAMRDKSEAPTALRDKSEAPTVLRDKSEACEALQPLRHCRRPRTHTLKWSHSQPAASNLVSTPLATRRVRYSKLLYECHSHVTLMLLSHSTLTLL